MRMAQHYFEGVTMDHGAVVREKMTERYLLDELKPEVRVEFEEHYFDCPACARDIRAGFEFVEQSKVVMAEPPEPVAKHAANRRSTRPGWFSWLRPAFAAPVLALLLAVIGYQNLVTLPKFKDAVTKPQVLPWASVNLGTWGDSGHAISVSQGKEFLLFVRIPPGGNYTQYTADLYNPKGGLEYSLTFPATPGQDQWPLQVPGATRESGSYKLTVHGVTVAGDSRDLGSSSFELQVQQ
jgi:hypothetical protein